MKETNAIQLTMNKSNQLKSSSAGIFLLLFLAMPLNIALKGKVKFNNGNWSQTIEKAKKEKKLVFLELTAPNNPDCDKLASTTFNDAEVATFINSHCISLQENSQEKEGKLLAQKLGTRKMPSLFFIDPKGKILERATGFKSSKDLLDMAKRAAGLEK